MKGVHDDAWARFGRREIQLYRFASNALIVSSWFGAAMRVDALWLVGPGCDTEPPSE
jgi:hypothetical protein